MPSRFDVNEQLEALEHELGPSLRTALRGNRVRPEFVATLRTELEALPAHGSRARPLWLVRSHAWAALAALLVVGLVSSTALFAARAQTASAEEVLSQVQSETVSMLAFSGSPCGDAPGGGGAGIAVFQTTDGRAMPAPGEPGAVALQAQPVGSSTELSDKLAQALGVSGDRVRDAMLASMRSVMPANLPPDRMAIIAQQLGLPQQQVCAAFSDSQSPFAGIVQRADGPNAGTSAGNEAFNARTSMAKPALALNAASPQQLASTAQGLGVSPERLAAAVHAAAEAPMPTPPPPPTEDELINTFAQNLGLSSDQVRAAIAQVEGPHTFYFAVPMPRFGQR